MTGRQYITLAVSCSLAFCSCRPELELMNASGESAEIRLRDGSVYELEIVAVQDSTLICLGDVAAARQQRKTVSSASVISIPVRSIDRIGIQGIRNGGWPFGVLCFQVLPAVGLGIAAGSVDGDNVAAAMAVGLVPAALTSLFFASSGLPTPTYEAPLTPDNLVDLRKYGRFAGILSQDQVKALLQAYQQEVPTVLMK